jgi:hypothetical protein
MYTNISQNTFEQISNNWKKFSSQEESHNTYVPKVPYHSASCSFSGIKAFWSVITITAIVLTIISALGFKHVILLPNYSLSRLGLIIGPIMTVAMVGLMAFFKGAYNQIYPQGNWGNFLKRNWSNFLGKNHQHFSKWEAQQPKKSVP